MDSNEMSSVLMTIVAVVGDDYADAVVVNDLVNLPVN